MSWRLCKGVVKRVGAGLRLGRAMAGERSARFSTGLTPCFLVGILSRHMIVGGLFVPFSLQFWDQLLDDLCFEVPNELLDLGLRDE